LLFCSVNASTVVEIPSLFQNKTVKRITFSAEGIRIEKPLSFDPPVVIRGEDISAFRFGVVFMTGYVFTLGRQYVIEIKDFQNNVFKIKLKSYYKIKRETYFKLWNELLAKLWENYFSNMLNYHTDLYNIHQIFELAGVKFLTDGISWKKGQKLVWKDIALSNYKTYFMIHHVENLKEHKSCNFASDWNAFILQSLLKKIIEGYK
jgi:hypothetical protein